MGLTNDVVFAGYAPDADLPALYSGAACSLVPSLYEGFGFPVLEAMACGVPVVCSNTSSLPEVAGDAAVLVPPSDYHALADAVRLVLTQTEYADSLRAQGIAQAAKFRWEKCAAETAALYHQVAQQAEAGAA
uniref:Glycos_transf_1 n=1 Tax=uncultured Thermoanaerobacter sp. TaxID=242695 RepID=A0A060CEP7_9THEO|nr:Glycos_transf_1 [uncultured Thermoanaerobacter sp.]